MTLRKLINFCAIEYAFFRRQTVVKGYPYELLIEPTNICQLKCPLCFTGAGKSGRAKGFMEFELYKKIINTLSPYAFHVFLHLWGESFLHKDINKFIQYAHNANLSTTISSNLSFSLDDKKVEDIINAGLDVLVVSLDGITPETYSKYRVGGDFEQVVFNIKLFLKKRKEMNSKTPHIKWHFIVMKHNEHQVGDAKRFANEIGVDSIVFANAYFREKDVTDSDKEKWLPMNNDLRNSKVFDKPEYLVGKCWWLWRGVVINWDRGISPCCNISDQSTDFGKFDESFKRVWNNPHYQSARNLFSRKKSKSGVNTVCHSCSVSECSK